MGNNINHLGLLFTVLDFLLEQLKDACVYLARIIFNRL